MFSLFICIQFLKDWILAVVVALLVSIDIVILLIYTAIELNKETFKPNLSENEENIKSLFGVSD